MDPTQPVIPPDQQIVDTKPQDPGYTNADLKAPIRDIASNTDEPKPTEPVRVADEPKPELDAVKIAEDAAKAVLDQQEATRKAEEDRVKAEDEAKKLEQEPTEKEKAYLDWEKKFASEKGRQPSYLEALTFVEEQAVRGIEEKQAAKAQADAAEQERVRKEQEDTNKRMDAVIDDELNELYTTGRLTKIQDPNNPSDQGVVERKALFTKWSEVNTERKAKGLPEIYSATRIYHGVDETGKPYFTRPNAQPAGANAPIMGNKGSVTPPSKDQEYTYADVRRPWSFFKRNS